MPLLGSSFLVGRQNTQPHCSGTFTGYAYQSESSFGCVFWHVTVCMAQHRRILQTAGTIYFYMAAQQNSDVGLRPTSEFVARRHLRSADTTTLLVPPTRRVLLLATAPFRWQRRERGTVCQHRSGPPRRCCLFGGRQRPICFSCRTTDF